MTSKSEPIFSEDVSDPNLRAAHFLRLSAVIAAGGLLAFGIILFVAANWGGFTRMERFGTVGSLIPIAAVLGAFVPRLRLPTALVGIGAIGGLMALFGQTYPTDANAYQLFVTWALLSLPWVIALRHDVTWFVWTVIAFTALGLYQTATTGRQTPELFELIPFWGMAGALCIALAPMPFLDHWRGKTRWSFRLAVVLLTLFIAPYGLFSTFDSSSDGALTLGSLTLLFLIAAVFSRGKLFDLGLLSFAALAINVILMAMIGRFIFDGGDEIGSFFLTGLLWAGLAAGSAYLLLKLSRYNGMEFALGRNPWPITALSAFGAILSSLPIMGFIAALIGELMDGGLPTYIVGGIITVGTVFGLRATKDKVFLQQLAFIWLVVGVIILAIAFYQDFSLAGGNAIMIALLIGVGYLVGVQWIAVLCGLGAAGLFVLLLMEQLQGGSIMDLTHVRALPIQIGAIVGLAGIAALAFSASQQRRDDDGIEGIVSGWATAVLLILMVMQPTFLLGGAIPSQWGTVFGEAIDAAFAFTPERIFSIVLGCASLCLLFLRVRNVRTPAGFAIGAIVVVLSFVMATMGPVVALGTAALLSGRRVLSLLSLIALVWLIGSFYYWLGWPLLYKAALMVGLGAALSGFLWLTRPKGDDDAPLLGQSPFPVLVTAALILLSATASTGLMAQSILQKEEIVRTGTKFYVKLAPVDPRSLIQGDYMALRFELPRDSLPSRGDGKNQPLWGIAELNERAIATIKTISTEADDAAFSIRLRSSGSSAILSTTAFFFEEGKAELFEEAEYGEFRVGDDRFPILVGLTDENLRRIE